MISLCNVSFLLVCGSCWFFFFCFFFPKRPLVSREWVEFIDSWDEEGALVWRALIKCADWISCEIRIKMEAKGAAGVGTQTVFGRVFGDWTFQTRLSTFILRFTHNSHPLRCKCNLIWCPVCSNIYEWRWRTLIFQMWSVQANLEAAKPGEGACCPCWLTCSCPRCSGDDPEGSWRQQTEDDYHAMVHTARSKHHPRGGTPA